MHNQRTHESYGKLTNSIRVGRISRILVSLNTDMHHSLTQHMVNTWTCPLECSVRLQINFIAENDPPKSFIESSILDAKTKYLLKHK